MTAIDNRISFTDQVMFLGQRATGQELVMQVGWVYEHPVDMAGVRRFYENFGHGLYGRRIERSPLPFGRHRWVSTPGPQAPLDVAEKPRPRSELTDWLDEQAQRPVDPEWGPGWRLAVLPMTDGSTAVSLVISHCLADGFGTLLTVADAVNGRLFDFGFPPPGSRTRWRAAAVDLRQTLQAAPELGRTLVKAVGQTFGRRHEFTRKPPEVSSDAGTQRVVAPAIVIYVDVADWDARAKELGGNTHSLVAGFTAKFGELVGRRRARDGYVTLNTPMSDRTPGDSRANAVILTDIAVDPTQVTTDLSQARAVIKQSLRTAREVPDETLELLPLTPFVPKRAVRRGADVVFNFADLPVSCSNLGDVDPDVARVDGTPAEYVVLRGVDRHVTRRFLELRGGLLTVVAGRIAGKMSISVIAYQPGRENSKSQLRELGAKVLAEFGLAGVIE